MTTCTRASCGRKAKGRGLCYIHVRLRGPAYRPADAAAEHIRELRGFGWTYEQIADAAQIHRNTPSSLHNNRYHRVRPETEVAILAIVAAPIGALRMPTSIGLRRRVQALAWMGWTGVEVARRAGTTYGSLSTLMLASRSPSWRYAQKVDAVYRDLAHVRGPSRGAAAKARGRGHHPPSAWFAATIDDPNALPVTSLRSGIDLAEVIHLELGGCHITEIARRMGVSVKGIEKARAVAKRAA